MTYRHAHVIVNGHEEILTDTPVNVINGVWAAGRASKKI